jgi:hypothetical protein
MAGTIRVRTAAWFAAAVVISVFATLLVMQEWRADAAAGDSDATWVAVEPCRLFDQRPGKQPLGGKKTPLAAGAPATQQVTGNVGNCKIPKDGVVAVSMNVTIVSPSAQSNLRLYPADAASEPVVSNLNWLAGDSATANKVDVKLSSTGAVKLAVANGTVNVLGDVVGYYTNSTLQEMANQLSTLAKALPFAVTSYVDGEQSVAGGIYVSVTVTAPVAGQVTLNSTAEVSHPVADEGGVTCKIVKAADGPSSFEGESGQRFMNHGLITKGTLSGTRTFDIAAGTVVKYGLACGNFGDTGGKIKSPNLTAIFTPTP